MKFASCLAPAALLASTVFALSGHTHHARDMTRAHRHLSARAHSAAAIAKRKNQNRLMLAKRKTPLGTGDSTSQPSNLADGSFGASQGCTCWHTVADGEVCLGLIDKSTAAFTIDVFHQYNPQVSSDCSNLVVGQAYCVDNGANSAAPSATTSSETSQATTQQLTSSNQNSSSDDSDSEEDCDDGDEQSPNTSGDNDDGDDCEDENEPSDDDDGEDCDDDEQSEESDSSSNAGLGVSVGIKVAQHAPTSSSALPTSTQGSSSSFSPSFSGGIGTWFTQNNNPGACGQVNSDSTYLVALYTSVYGNGSHCGRKVQIKNTANGNTATAVVADECPSCNGANCLDMSTGLFNDLSNNNPGEGTFPIVWSFLD